MGSCWSDGLDRKEDNIFLMFSQLMTTLSQYCEEPVLTPVRRARRDRRASRGLWGRLFPHPCAAPAPTDAGALQAFQCRCFPLLPLHGLLARTVSVTEWEGISSLGSPPWWRCFETFKEPNSFPTSLLIYTSSALDALHCK